MSNLVEKWIKVSELAKGNFILGKNDNPMLVQEITVEEFRYIIEVRYQWMASGNDTIVVEDWGVVKVIRNA